MTYQFKTMNSPVGTLRLIANSQSLAAILWEHDQSSKVLNQPLIEDTSHQILRETEQQLKDYFANKLQQFNLPLDLAGTAFQKKVWQALATIPYGETRSYAQIAKQIDHPKAMRAVGAANGKNPIPIIIPCHRVIGANGTLTGFGGGLDNKATLLNLEKA